VRGTHCPLSCTRGGGAKNPPPPPVDQSWSEACQRQRRSLVQAYHQFRRTIAAREGSRYVLYRRGFSSPDLGLMTPYFLDNSARVISSRIASSATQALNPPSRDHALHDPAGSGTNGSFVLSFWIVTFIMRSTLTTGPKFRDRLFVCLKIVPEPKRKYDYQKQDLALSRSKNHITIPISVNHPHYTCLPFHKTGRSCI
jgi:hypothetical protein